MSQTGALPWAQAQSWGTGKTMGAVTAGAGWGPKAWGSQGVSSGDTRGPRGGARGGTQSYGSSQALVSSRIFSEWDGSRWRI